jgi:hypothetical protein
MADNRGTADETRRTFQDLLPKHPMADSVYSMTDYRPIVVTSVISITVGLLREKLSVSAGPTNAARPYQTVPKLCVKRSHTYSERGANSSKLWPGPSRFRSALMVKSNAHHARKTGSGEEILVFSPVSSAALSWGSGSDASSIARSKMRSSPGGTAAVTFWLVPALRIPAFALFHICGPHTKRKGLQCHAGHALRFRFVKNLRAEAAILPGVDIDWEQNAIQFERIHEAES